MSIDLADIEILTAPPKVERDRWGRYLLPHPDHPDERVAHTRATTVAKAPEDQGGLIKWGQRTVALGMGRRPDLVALAATVDPDDRKALGRIAADAEEAGGATANRNTGTAIHAAIEAVNLGAEPLPLFAAEVDAYRAALAAAHLEPVPQLVERIVVHHEHRIAGTFDVALRDTRTGELMVSDLKTGSVDYPASFAIQLAIYATAESLVTPDLAGYEAVPEWSRDHGIIIHLPAGGPCTLHRIDLAAGARGLAVALDVRAWRTEATARHLLSPVVTDDTIDAGPPTTDTTPVASDGGTVERPTTTEGRRRPTREPRPSVTAGAEEGDDVPAEKIAALRAQAAEVEVVRVTVARWVVEGARHDVDWNPGTTPCSERRYALAVTAVALAEHLAAGESPQATDEVARAALRLVIGENADRPTLAVGGLIGSLTIEQARRLYTIATSASLAYSDDGSPVLDVPA